MYIDTHCHLDSDDYKDDFKLVISHSIELGLERIIIPGADIADLPRAIKLAECYDEVYFASGIHPNEIANLNEDSKAALNLALNHSKCVAIGEVGLDYHYLDSNMSCAQSQKMSQKIGFRYQIELAISHNKPLIIHTRDSSNDVIDILQDYEADLKAVIFHCFGGDMMLVNALKCPCYYGIGGIISFKSAQILQNSVKQIPLESLLLETDAPYLAPTPYRGKRNTPEYIPLINTVLAANLEIDDMKLAQITTQNAKKVFGF